MGDEADRLISRMIEGRHGVSRAARRPSTKAVLVKGEAITTEKLSAERLVVQDPPRTVENMPEEMKAELAKMSEGMRAVKILAWLEDISFSKAKDKINAFRRREREQAEAEERDREFHERMAQLSAAKTLEDLKPLLSEIIEQLWSHK